MTTEEEIIAVVKEADEWLDSHRHNDTWMVMSRLRDTLVRVQTRDQKPPFDRQRIYAAERTGVDHLFDMAQPDRTLCGLVQDPVAAMKGAMLKFMGNCEACDEEYDRLVVGSMKRVAHDW